MKIGSRQTVLSAAVLTALTALPVAPVALAQDGVLEEVVVTSRKRTENLQDVGFAVSALHKERNRRAVRSRHYRSRPIFHPTL
jgi:iron complex outermembrane receptor protein